MAAEIHSNVGPSRLEQIMNCTGSLLASEGIADTTSEYAEAGTATHKLAEWKLRKALKQRAGKRPVSDYWTDEMEELTDDYRDFCMDQLSEAKRASPHAIAFVEQQVNIEEYAPGCFGTVDYMAISDKTLFVTDLKWGRGVQKEAENNPQLMAYGLGALEIALPIFEVEEVVLTIYQPRLDHVSQWTVSVEDLLAWAKNELKPKVEEALSDHGTFHAGDWCRFCKARETCRARADHYLKLIDLEFKPPALLTDEEIAEVMSKAEGLGLWVSDVMAYASAQAIDNGKHWPGYKIVEGRSVRKFSAPEDTIAEAAKAAGYSDIYTKSLITLTAFEKLMGKEVFADVLGKYVTKPAGKLTLVPESDKRPAVTVTDINDFND